MQRTAPIFIIAFVVIAATNIAFRAWRAWKTRRMEAARLRLGLQTEMGQLLALLEGNVRALSEATEEKRLATMRGADIFFRANAGRLSVLDDDVEAIVRAYSAIECTDRMIAAASVARGPTSHRIGAGEAAQAILEQLARLREYMQAAEAALAAARRRTSG